MRRLDLASETAGVQSLDFAGRMLDASDLEVFVSSMRVAIGGWTNVDEARAAVLFQHIMDKSWSKDHLDAVLYQFAEKKLYGGKWSMGDFFDCDLVNDLHPYAWVLAEIEHGRSMREMEGYRFPLNDKEKIVLWRYKAEPMLPFERIAIP